MALSEVLGSGHQTMAPKATQGGQSPQIIPEPLPCPGALPTSFAIWGCVGDPPFVPKPTQGQFPALAAWQSQVLGTPNPWVRWGAQSPSNTRIWVFSHLTPFFLPKLRQIFPGCEIWTSNPVPNTHHVIQLGQKSKTSHLSESRGKCFSPQAHAAEGVSEIADLYP